MPDVRISELTAGAPLAAADLVEATQGGNSRKVTGAQLRTGLALAGAPSTGILDGGAITINADPAKVDIAAGTGYVADHTTYPPTITVVTWTAKSAVVLSALATRDSTDLAIDVNGDVVQQALYTAEELRSVIFLGGANHQNRTSVSQVFSIQVPSFAPALSVRDLARALGDVNIDGNNFTSNGANLKLNKSAGSTFSFGRNVEANPADPHTLTQASQTQVSFFPIFDNGSGVAVFATQTTDLDPNNRDNGTGTLAAVGSNKWTIQRVSMFSNTGLVLVQYGVTEYNKKAQAVAAVATEPFISLTGSKSATIRAYIVIQQGATTLANAEIISVDRLGFASAVVNDAINLTTDTETDLSGIIKGASGTLDTATAGTDYVAPGAVTSSGLTQATARLLGRTTASTGAVEEITAGTGLTLSGGSLSVTTNTYQPVDATLTSLAGLNIATDSLPYGTGADTFGTTTLTSFARTLLDDTTQGAMQTTLGLVPGSNIQEYDSDLAALAALATNGIIARGGEGEVVTRTITGTASRVSITNGGGVAGNPTINIDTGYVGQTSITTLGTVSTGTWQGTIIGAAYGGTGVANTGRTITLGGNLTTSGAFTTTLTVTGNTNVTLPTTGTLVAQGVITSSGLTMATARLLGRTTASTGAVEEISVGTGLTLSAGTLTGGAAAGAWVEISRATASDSATVDFTGIGSTYDCYMVEFYNVVPAVDGSRVAIRTSTDGGSSYDSGASDYNNEGTTDNYLVITGNIGNDTSENGSSGNLMMFRPSQAARCQFLWDTTNLSSAGAMNRSYSAGMRVADADVDAIRFLTTSGNIASGVFVLLGRKK